MQFPCWQCCCFCCSAAALSNEFEIIPCYAPAIYPSLCTPLKPPKSFDMRPNIYCLATKKDKSPKDPGTANGKDGTSEAELTYCNLCKMQISSLMTAAILCSIVVSGARVLLFFLLDIVVVCKRPLLGT